MSERWDALWRQHEMQRQSTPELEHNGNTVVHLPGSDGCTQYGHRALADECRAVAATGVGNRNDALNKAAFRMGRLVPDHLSYEAAYQALTDAGQASGLGATEVAAVLRDAENAGLKRGATHPRQPAPLKPLPTPTILDEAVSGEDISNLIRERFPLLDWHELWTTEDDDEWIIEPLIPARRLVALFSAPKVGKSLLMLEVAVAMARGTSILGVTPDRPRRVLYVDFENDPRGDIRERLQNMGHEPGDLGDLCYLSYPSLAKLDTVAGAAELMAIIAEYECEVVVIDTISRAVAGEENENDTWLSFYRNTGLAMKQAGVTCIRLDHTGKDHDKGMRGGSAKYGDVDLVWKLSAVTGDMYQLDCTDHRLPVAEKQIVVKRVEDPDLRHQVQGGGWMDAQDAKVEAAIALLDQHDIDPALGRDKARKELRQYVSTELPGNGVMGKAIKARKNRLRSV